MKLTDSSLCTFCREYEESLEHLFLNCQFNKDFWMHSITWLEKFNVTIARKIIMDTSQPNYYYC